MKYLLLKLTALTLAAPLLVSCNSGAPTYITSAQVPSSQISVSATGNSQVSPDRASVSAGVVTQGPDAGKAMQANANLMSKVFAELEAAQIPKANIATSQLSLQPRYDYSNRKAPRITSYEARNTVTVKTDNLEQVGPMLDALVAAGVNNINQVQFSVKDPKAAKDAARITAIKEAKTKAQTMADAAGVKLGKLQSLSESGSYSPQPMYRMEAAMADGRASTPVAPGEQTLSVTVNMIYGIE